MISRCFLFVALAGVCLAQTQPTTTETSSKNTTAAEHQPAAADPVDVAQAMMHDGKYVEAAAAFRGILDKDPSLMRAHVGLMRSLLRTGKIEDAEEAARKAVAVLPNSPPVHAMFGDVEFRAGKFAEAEAQYRACLKIDETSARGWYGMGRMYQMLSMSKHAKDAYTNAHDFDPKDEVIFEHWLDLLPYPEQLQALEKRAGDHPTDRQKAAIKFLTEVSKQKPWALAKDVKKAELKMLPYGRELAGIDTGSRIGAQQVSKGYGLQLKFNDRATATLLLDTGADGVVIGRKLAEKAGVVKIADTYFGGLGDSGPVQGYYGWVDKITIGDLEFHHCVVVVSSKNDVADESGLIGADIFRKFLITLDFRNWKMFLNPLPENPAFKGSDDDPQDRYVAPEMQSYTKIYQLDDHLFIPAVVSDKAAGNFMLDTGADLNITSPKIAAQVTKTSYEGMYLKGVSGSVKEVLNGDKAILQFARVRVRSDDIPIIDLLKTSNSFGTEVAGLIGIRTLVQMKMTIDYRDGLVDLAVYDFRKARE
jgi:Tfp pilus assembly protein PilF/predicted aspartyl protease